MTRGPRAGAREPRAHEDRSRDIAAAVSLGAALLGGLLSGEPWIVAVMVGCIALLAVPLVVALVRTVRIRAGKEPPAPEDTRWGRLAERLLRTRLFGSVDGRGSPRR